MRPSLAAVVSSLSLVVPACERAATPTPQQDESACATGDTTACARRLARMKTSCDAKVVQACIDAADAHATPLYAPKDDRQAAIYFERACDLSDARSCAMLADLRVAGRGVPKNVAAAGVLDERACTLGRGSSCRERAQCLELGDIVRGCTTRDLKKARELWARYCTLEKVEACVDVTRVEAKIATGG